MTKSFIKNALLELLESRELTGITVTAVCDSADVHRSTFYKYYTDTENLLREIEQDLLNQIPMPLPGMTQEQLLRKSAAFFDYVKQNENAFRILFSRSAGSNFSDHLTEVLCSGYIPASVDDENPAAHFTRLYFANGTVGMLKEWVMKEFPVSSQKIAERMYFLSRKVIA